MESRASHASQGAHARLIEAWFPYIEVSRFVAADRRGRDPVYGVHKWFARRPPTLVRALLLASHFGRDVGQQTFWEGHRSPGHWLNDAVVYDPFMGGGTSLVESARMGASVAGRDVDPLAVAIVGSELHGPVAQFKSEAEALIERLNGTLGGAFAGPDKDWTPLHWFWLTRPECGRCGEAGLLYKDLIIATSSGKPGSVTRDDEMHTFCPECLTVHAMKLNRKEVRCCGRRHRIHTGTYKRGKYFCPGCGESSSYEDLAIAQAERVLVAVEETRTGHHRRIRSAQPFDQQLVIDAAKTAPAGADFDVALETKRRDRRPVSVGFSTTRSLFTSRQWAVFVYAFSDVRNADHSVELERDLTLMLTGALSSNNLLCGYARDWGRLAPLFSVRGFSVPALTVELNPFHPTSGRGTFKSALNRISERVDTRVRRAATVNGRIKRHWLDLPVQASSVDVMCRSADDPAGQEGCDATVCVTDPPYFDYIAYSELSEFFRVWLRAPELAGTPLLPESSSPVDTFATGLGGALKSTLTRLRPNTPLVFTYHSAKAEAWQALGEAFDIADLSVVALWPVLADPHMGHHAAEGNCEWDVVVVARHKDEVTAVSADELGDWPANWLGHISKSEFRVGKGDLASFKHAWAMAKPRIALVSGRHTSARKPQ
ncbi:hypothetical protein ACH35V_21170 [Actinomadura sp. 1N219]|uniref:hypothetical protein n=1 Tax=Actinomadura sp. 1N219 TaxID=3375152 RepID=UPI0037B48545